MYFLLNLVSTSLSYFLPTILQSGMGLSSSTSILLSAPPYYYSTLPVLLTSYLADRHRSRGPTIIFNSLCLIAGFAMLGFATHPAVRYAGTFLATGAYIANWAALAAYQGNNIVGQWKRVFTVAAVTACNGAGGIAGSFIVRRVEAPRYATAVWVSIGSHVLMIGVVLLFSGYFYVANGRQRRTGKVIEGQVSRSFVGLLGNTVLTDGVGGVSLYLLIGQKHCAVSLSQGYQCPVRSSQELHRCIKSDMKQYTNLKGRCSQFNL